MDLGLILIGIIGLMAGGVVNLLADDLPHGTKLHFPPRYPDKTPRPPIAWLGSTAFLFGRRASPGGAKLSWRYPLTELLTAALLIVTVLAVQDDPVMTPLQLAFWLLYMTLFALITVIDIEHRLILFIVVIPGCVIALADALLTRYGADVGSALIGGAMGFAVFFIMYIGGYLFTFFVEKVRKQEVAEVAFGYGDVMLITLSGLILGWQPLIMAMFVTVFLGAFGAILYLVVRWLSGRHYSFFTPLPYGPYIVAGTILMLVFSTELTALLWAPAY
jgi:prepilin signal peptidase PulO-like enzyme (type II secretory pathway)